MPDALFLPMNAEAPDRQLALSLLLPAFLDHRPPDEDKRWNEASPLCRELVWGCLRHRSALEACLDHLSHRPPDAELRPLLALGLYQVLLLDGVADHAAVHETLEAARHLRFPQARIGYANALLRRAIREREALHGWIDSLPPATRFSHPEFLVNGWNEAYGAEHCDSILRWNQQRSSTWVRLTARGKLHHSAGSLPPGSEPHPLFPDFWRLPRGISPTEIHGFPAGDWYAQDPSTSLAPALLAVAPGEQVLDACAAPGGKTLLLAEALGQGGLGLTAADPNPRRVRRLRENLARTGIDQVRVLEHDLGRIQETFDAVLLDVPCSNTGVLQRRPDARWNVSRTSLRQLALLQADILRLAAPRVRPGGRLVYSTCSIEPPETTRQLQAWLQNHPEWTLRGEILLLPGEKNCDGAYAALLQHNG